MTQYLNIKVIQGQKFKAKYSVAGLYVKVTHGTQQERTTSKDSAEEDGIIVWNESFCFEVEDRRKIKFAVFREELKSEDPWVGTAKVDLKELTVSTMTLKLVKDHTFERHKERGILLVLISKSNERPKNSEEPKPLATLVRQNSQLYENSAVRASVSGRVSTVAAGSTDGRGSPVCTVLAIDDFSVTCLDANVRRRLSAKPRDWFGHVLGCLTLPLLSSSSSAPKKTMDQDTLARVCGYDTLGAIRGDHRWGLDRDEVLRQVFAELNDRRGNLDQPTSRILQQYPAHAREEWRSGEKSSLHSALCALIVAADCRGDFLISVLKGRNLKSMDLNGFSDPYVKIKHDGHKFKTKVIKHNLDPEWKNENFTIPKVRPTAKILVEVIDYDRTSKNDSMGQFVISVAEHCSGAAEIDWHTVVLSGKAAGELLLTLQFVPTPKINPSSRPFITLHAREVYNSLLSALVLHQLGGDCAELSELPEASQALLSEFAFRYGVTDISRYILFLDLLVDCMEHMPVSVLLLAETLTDILRLQDIGENPLSDLDETLFSRSRQQLRELVLRCYSEFWKWKAGDAQALKDLTTLVTPACDDQQLLASVKAGIEHRFKSASEQIIKCEDKTDTASRARELVQLVDVVQADIVSVTHILRTTGQRVLAECVMKGFYTPLSSAVNVFCVATLDQPWVEQMLELRGAMHSLHQDLKLEATILGITMDVLPLAPLFSPHFVRWIDNTRLSLLPKVQAALKADLFVPYSEEERFSTSAVDTLQMVFCVMTEMQLLELEMPALGVAFLELLCEVSRTYVNSLYLLISSSQHMPDDEFEGCFALRPFEPSIKLCVQLNTLEFFKTQLETSTSAVESFFESLGAAYTGDADHLLMKLLVDVKHVSTCVLEMIVSKLLTQVVRQPLRTVVIKNQANNASSQLRFDDFLDGLSYQIPGPILSGLLPGMLRRYCMLFFDAFVEDITSLLTPVMERGAELSDEHLTLIRDCIHSEQLVDFFRRGGRELPKAHGRAALRLVSELANLYQLPSIVLIEVFACLEEQKVKDKASGVVQQEVVTPSHVASMLQARTDLDAQKWVTKHQKVLVHLIPEEFGLPDESLFRLHCFNKNYRRGMLYIMTEHLCFDTTLFARGHSRYIQAYSNIKEIVKCDGPYTANAIKIVLYDGSFDYFFGLSDRQKAVYRIHGQAALVGEDLDVCGEESNLPQLSLSISKIKVHNLKAMDSTGTSDPYIVVQFGGTRKRTIVQKRCLDAAFDAEFEMVLETGSRDVHLECYDWNPLVNNLIGRATFTLASLVQCPAYSETKPLVNAKGEQTGSISVTLELKPPSAEAKKEVSVVKMGRAQKRAARGSVFLPMPSMTLGRPTNPVLKVLIENVDGFQSQEHASKMCVSVHSPILPETLRTKQARVEHGSIPFAASLEFTLAEENTMLEGELELELLSVSVFSKDITLARGTLTLVQFDQSQSIDDWVLMEGLCDDCDASCRIKVHVALVLSDVVAPHAGHARNPSLLARMLPTPKHPQSNGAH